MRSLLVAAFDNPAIIFPIGVRLIPPSHLVIVLADDFVRVGKSRIARE